MAWVKLDDQARHHRKILAAGPVGAWLWVCGLMYCNSQKARDGFIPTEAVPVLYPLPTWRREAIRLAAIGLWEPVEGGYRVHDYHDYQPTAEDGATLSEKRSAAGRAGAAKRWQPDGKPDGKTMARAIANVDSKPIARPGPSRPGHDPPVGPPGGEDAGPPRITRAEDQFWISAYTDAVRDSFGASWGFPTKQTSGLRSAVEAHCPNKSAADAWIRETVARFVQATKSKPSVWSSFGPDGFLRWLNAKCPDETDASGVRTVGGASPRARRDLTGYEP